MIDKPPTNAELDLLASFAGKDVLGIADLRRLREYVEAVSVPLNEALNKLTDGTSVILPKNLEHARAMYLVAFRALQEFDGNDPTEKPEKPCEK